MEDLWLKRLPHSPNYTMTTLIADQSAKVIL